MEEKIKRLLGEYIFAITSLEVQLEAANARIAELEKEKANKPDLKVVENQ